MIFKVHSLRFWGFGISGTLSSKPCLAAGGRTVNPIKLETGLRPNSAGIPYTCGFPTFGLLLYNLEAVCPASEVWPRGCLPLLKLD